MIHLHYKRRRARPRSRCNRTCSFLSKYSHCVHRRASTHVHVRSNPGLLKGISRSAHLSPTPPSTFSSPIPFPSSFCDRLATQWRHRRRATKRSVCNAGASNAGRSLCVQISRERSYPLAIYWYHSKGNWLRYNFAAEGFYIMKLCSWLYCRNCPKDDKFRYFIPILRKLRAA